MIIKFIASLALSSDKRIRERMCHPRERVDVTPRERGDVSLWLIENNKPSTYSCNFTDASLIYVIGYNEYFSFRYSHNFELFRAN